MDMTKKADGTIPIECPCCRATLNVDPQLGVVFRTSRRCGRLRLISTIPPGCCASRPSASKKNSVYRWKPRKSKEDVLARKFAEGLKKAKDKPIEKPLRDFDLD